MDIKERNFDKDAASWDEKPSRIKLADDLVQALMDEKIPASDMDVMDFGCGTGLLTLRLRPHVRSIEGVDSSEGMLNVLRAKVESQRVTNVKTQCLDLGKGDVLQGRYHMIVSGMVFHHVREIKPLFGQFYDHLNPGGYLCVADLDFEGGEFHENHDGVYHHGFDRAALRRDFVEAGFGEVRDRTAAKVAKTRPGGGKREFSVFLFVGRK